MGSLHLHLTIFPSLPWSKGFGSVPNSGMKSRLFIRYLKPTVKANHVPFIIMERGLASSLILLQRSQLLPSGRWNNKPLLPIGFFAFTKKKKKALEQQAKSKSKYIPKNIPIVFLKFFGTIIEHYLIHQKIHYVIVTQHLDIYANKIHTYIHQGACLIILYLSPAVVWWITLSVLFSKVVRRCYHCNHGMRRQSGSQEITTPTPEHTFVTTNNALLG